MKLIAGLGNPGRKYAKTRHNMGFIILDNYLSSKNAAKAKKKFNGEYTELDINGEKVIFLKPQAYINLSGEVIKQYLDYFKIDSKDLLVIHDDMDTDFGSFKIKKSGSSAGHNGLKNIEERLGTKDYKRIKVGISQNAELDKSDYVLSKIPKEDKLIVLEIADSLIEVIDEYFQLSFDNLMNKYNKK